MQSCQFAKSVIERGSGSFSAARPAAVSSAELQYSRSRPSSLCFRNHSEMLTMVCSRARLRVRLSWSSQILLHHVLDLRTPLPRQGNVTDSFIPSVPYIHSALVVNGSGLMYYQLQLGWVVLFILFRFGGSAFCGCLFVVGVRIYHYFRGKACDMFIHFRVIIFFSPALPLGRRAYSLANLP